MRLCYYDRPKFTEADRPGLQMRIDNRQREIAALQTKIDKLKSEIKIYEGIIKIIN